LFAGDRFDILAMAPMPTVIADICPAVIAKFAKQIEAIPIPTLGRRLLR
jgi:hypothetical protein